MTDNTYKDTLNLPKTEFPMRANLAAREPVQLAEWEKQGLYEKIREKRKAAPRYILHDGPPYANGEIHLGHAINKVLKDFVLKAQNLNGLDAPFIPGWDCHGLPIELNVEKKHAKKAPLVPQAFRAACREYAQSQVSLQKKAFERLGVLGDWKHPYLTMSFAFEADIIRTLAKIVKNDYVYRGEKPVHWCVNCRSALAEAELEYVEKESDAIDVAFAAISPDKSLINTIETAAKLTAPLPADFQLFLPVWTTTPWTLPANQAVAVHPALSYVCLLQRSGQKGFIVARDLAEACMLRYGFESSDYTLSEAISAEALLGLHLQHPFVARKVPVIAADHVTAESGTGLVHIAPAHGEEDYLAGKKYDLSLAHTVMDNGCFAEDAPLFAGLFVFKANAEIIALLKNQGALLAEARILHPYPHCWRHKFPVLFRSTPQWFIRVKDSGLATAALEAIKNIDYLPAWGRSRMQNMLENRPDWCISRQRRWGVPLPFFVHKVDKSLHPKTLDFLEQVAQGVEKAGVDYWFDCSADIFLAPEEISLYEKVTDVLDVWFDSGASYAAVLQARTALQFPADLYLEGSDQYRGWFQTSLLSSLAATDIPAYKQIISHGFTVDSHGRKMSKSLGNTIAPDKVINSLGADILRLWVAMTDYRAEMVVSDEAFKRTADNYRRIRNTARFLLANLADFDPEKDSCSNNQLLALDAWIIEKALVLQNELRQAFGAYQFHTIAQKIHHFCSVDLGSFYLDIIKDRQYTMQKNSLGRRSAQTAIYHVLQALVRWLAPILSFTAEEIWHYLPKKTENSVFLTEWYTALTVSTHKEKNLVFWQAMMLYREQVNLALEKARQQALIGSALEADVILYAGPEIFSDLKSLGDELRFVLITASVSVLPLEEKTEKAVATAVKDLFVQIEVSPAKKCERCWHHHATVGKIAEAETLCARCVKNVFSTGEVRQFA